jgi:hypothetical protein
MSGNVWEWEDACDVDASNESGAFDLCRRRGGSFTQLEQNEGLECADASAQPRRQASDNLGFRCCGG